MGRCIRAFKDHLKEYSINSYDFINIFKFILKMREKFDKDECYAAFCLTGDPNVKGTYPVNLLNIMRRIWYMLFSLDIKLSKRSLKSSLKAALENSEIKSFWERDKRDKPICNYDYLKAAAGNIKVK